MSDSTKSTRQRIRTFAQDLEQARAQRGKKVAPAKTPAPKEHAPESHPTPKPKVVQESPKVIPPKESEPAPAPKPAPTPIIPPKPVPASKASKPIPAFHELQKQVDTIQKSEQKPVKENISVPKEIKRPKHIKQTQRPNIGYDATVIRDTKSNRFKLIPSIVQSIKEWFASLQPKPKRKEAPQYAVPETNRRKGVIQKATSKTGALFAADNDEIRERIRQRNAHAEAEMPAHEPETSWSPYTDAGYHLLDAPHQSAPDVTKNVKIEFKRTLRHESEDHQEMPPVPAAPEPVSIPEPAVTPRSPEVAPAPAGPEDPTLDLDEARWAASSRIEEAVRATPEETVMPASPVFNNPDTEFVSAAPAPDRDREQPEMEEDAPRRWLDRVDTNTLTVILLVAIIGILFAVFAVRVYYLNLDTNTETDSVAVASIESDSIISGATVSAITISADSLDRLPQLIREGAENAPVGLVELAVISPIGDEISPSYLFELLRFRTVANLRQSITTMRFVTVNRTTPSLLMQYVDEDTVRGGLLTWEPNLANDMRIIYDIPAEANVRFTDEQIEGTDVRVLTIDGTTVLVYGFVGQRSLLISGSTADFAQIVDLGFSQ